MLRAMAFTRPPVRLPAHVALVGVVLVALTGCERRRGCAGDYCGTLVFAAAGEPDILLPPVTQQQYALDIFGQVFLKLADLGLSQNTIGDEDFQPRLAQRWEWDDPLTLVFHLDPRARWQDGQSVTAADVAFTFDIYTDSLVNSPFRSSLRTTSTVTARDTQVIAGDADAVEVLGPPDNVKRAQVAANLPLYPYRGELYGRLAFNLSTNGDTTNPHPLFGDRQLRRALAMAVDREGLRKSVWGDLAQVPPGPLARLWSIWDPETRQLPYDTAQAARMLTWLGWRDSNGHGIRDRDGQPLA